MSQQSQLDMSPISMGRELPIHDRFGFRSLLSRAYKHTPQTELEIDIHLPFDWQAGDRRPGILFFFGGGWRTGTRHQFTRQCSYLASRGMVAATADYRVRQYHGTDVATCVEDAFSAMRWFRAHADELGLDPDRNGIFVCASQLTGHASRFTPGSLPLQRR